MVPKKKKKLKPTRREPEPSMFEKDEDDPSDVPDTGLEHSLTESEELDMSQRRYTRNQKQMIGAKMASCVSPQKNQEKSTPQQGRSRSSRKTQDQSTPQRVSTRASPKPKEVSHRRHSPRPTASSSLPVPREMSNSPRRASPKQVQTIHSSPEKPGSPTKVKQSTPLKVKHGEDINIANSMSVPAKSKLESKVDNESLLNTSMDTVLEKKMKHSPMPKKRSHEDSETEVDAKKPKGEKGEWKDIPDPLGGFIQLDIGANVPTPNPGKWLH